MPLFFKPFNVFNSLFNLFGRRRKVGRSQRNRTRSWTVEPLESRVLLTSSWLAGLTSDGYYVMDQDGTDRTEFSISPDGQVVIGGGETNLFELDAAGNVTIAGTLSTASSESFKENFQDVDVTRTLELISGLPIYGWNYRADTNSSLHVSPLAEDFSAFFNLGEDPTRLAPSDLASVTLVGIQGLSSVIEQHQAQIDQLATELGSSGRIPLPLFQTSTGGYQSLFDPIAVTMVAQSITSGQSTSYNGVESSQPFVGPIQYPTVLQSTESQPDTPITLFASSVNGQPLLWAQTSSQGNLVLQNDRVVQDDEVVIGQLAIGSNADETGPFGTDTLRLSDDVLRIHFQDTSVSSSFPTNDWRIVVNDDFLNGDSHFSIQDIDNGTIPFRIEAGDSGNALVIDESGNVGFGTDQAAANLQLVSADSPTIRLEQTDGTSQVWDLAGNESGFFVRDVSSGDILPFRIVAGADDNSLTIGPDGSVGVGTQNADAALHVASTDGSASITIEETSENAADRDLLVLQNQGGGQISFVDTSTGTTVNAGQNADNGYMVNFTNSANPEFELGADGSLQLGTADGTFVLDENGNLTVAGTVSTPSSVTLKENFLAVDTYEVLQQVDDLSILLWNYIADADSIQHMSPLAEEFYETFGLGDDPQHIAPADLGGIAVASIQALTERIELQNEQIAYLSWVAGLEFDSANLAEHDSTSHAIVDMTTPETQITPEGNSDSGSASTNANGFWERQSNATLQTSTSTSSSQLVLAASTVEDSVVVGSLHVGNNAQSGYASGFDTVRLSDDVIRVHFEDTTSSEDYSSNDWRIVINDEAVDGESHFSIVDVETGETRFRIDANAPENALLVDALGRLGLGTDSPQQDIHVQDGDTPTIRLEQTSSDEYTASLWDIAGNEVNFFIQDSTNGNLVPFKIHATATADSLYVTDAGNIGIGTDAANSSVHVVRDDGTAQVLITERSETTAQRELLHLSNHGGSTIAITDASGPQDVTWRTGVTGSDEFVIDLLSTTGSELTIGADGEVVVGPDGAENFVLDANGNLTIAGTLNQGSSYTLKENFSRLNASTVLDRLSDLPIYRWNYIDDGSSVQHLGPTAEDFYDAFGLGEDAQHIAASDMITVALSGLQGLMEAVVHQGGQLETISNHVDLEWNSIADWNVPSKAIPSVIDVDAIVQAATSSNASSASQLETMTTAGHVVSLPNLNTTSKSALVIHSLQDGQLHEDEPESLFLAETGNDGFFVWQDQDLSTPDVTDIYYDFRDEGGFENHITSTQESIAESMLADWENASDGSIQFSRNTIVDRTQIINIGVGELETFGFTSQSGGTLAVGGGVVTSGVSDSITNGVVWLDFEEKWDLVTGNQEPSGTYDMATVFLHEIGHTLGLGHTDHIAGVDVMDGSYQGEVLEFSEIDRGLIQFLYADASFEPVVEEGTLVLLEDQVLFGDQYFANNVGVGVDAANGMIFGTDTLRLIENNLRIGFNDTSSDGSPNVDWQITVNDSSNGGQSYFSIDQQSSAGGASGSSKFRILAGARKDSLVIDSSNRIGLGTRSPEEDLHLVQGTTPTIRLEQDTSSGFSNSQWDFGGDDASFFIQNALTSESIFQIETGAAANSLLVDHQGYVGVGHDAPDARFHILRDDGSAQLQIEETSSSIETRNLAVLQNNGGALIRFSNLVLNNSTDASADNPQLGVAKTASVDGSVVTFDYTIENLGNEEITNLSLTDDLDEVFGAYNYSITSAPTLISDPGTIELNTVFDGSDEINLLNSGVIEGTDGRTGNGVPGSTLAVGETAQIRIVVQLDQIEDQGSGFGLYSSQVSLTGRDSIGGLVTDLSDSGSDPDPNGNGVASDAGEDDPTEFSVAENPAIGIAADVFVGDITAAIINAGGSISSNSGNRVVLTWNVENLGNVELSDISLPVDLDSVFGAGNYGAVHSSGLPEVTIIGEGSLTRNSGFNGSTQNVVISSGTLSPGSSAIITAEILVTNITDVGYGLGVYSHQATISATGPDSTPVSDVSNAGTTPDPNGNGNANEDGENEQTPFALGAHIGVALDSSVVGSSATFNIYLEAFGSDDLIDLSLIDDLDTVFGEGNYAITAPPVFVDDPGTLLLNQNFDGSDDQQLLASEGVLAAGDTAQISFTVTVNTLRNNGSGLGVYEQQLTAIAEGPFGLTVSDLSGAGTDPDPNGDENPKSTGEATATTFSVISDAVVGVASQVAVNDNTVTFDLYLENFGGATAENLSLVDDLDAVFGAGNYTITTAPSLIDDPGTLVLNAGFDGHSDTSLLGTLSTLNGGATAQIQFVIELTQLADPSGLGLGVYRHQAVVSGTDSSGLRVIDRSDDQTDPDSFNSDGDPTFPGLQDPPLDGEDDANVFLIGDVGIGASLNAFVDGTQVIFDYTVENLGDHTITNISASHSLLSVLGFGNYSTVTQATVIDGPDTVAVNTAFDGLFSTALILNSSLAAGESARIRYVFNVTTVTNQGNGVGVYDTEWIVSGFSPIGTILIDTSTDGILPDPDGDGDATEAGENQSTFFILGEEPSIGISTDISVSASEVTIDYYGENLGNVDLTALSFKQNLDEIFGEGNYSVSGQPTLIDDPGTLDLNLLFDGLTETDLLTSDSSLAVGDTFQLRLVVDVNTSVNLGLGIGEYRQQTLITAMSPSGLLTGDYSFDGTDPDPNGNGIPSDVNENGFTFFTVASPQVGAALNAEINGQLVTLTYQIENLGNTELDDFSLTVDLDSIFGAGNYVVVSLPALTSSRPSMVLDPNFDGRINQEMIRSGNLAAGNVDVIEMVVRVDYITDQGSGEGVYSHQVNVSASSPDETLLTDLSDSGLVSDSNGNGSGSDSEENDQTSIQFDLVDSFVVTTVIDEDNGTSDATFGTGTSLREAIALANSMPGANTITFAPELAGQTVTLSHGWTGSGDTSSLVIADDLSIEGLATGDGVVLAIDSLIEKRHFDVSSSASLTLNDLTLTGGNVSGGGGAIRNQGDLTIHRSTLTGNVAVDGGAILSNAGSSSLSVTNSTFAGNTASSDGGAIWTGSTSNTLQNVTIVDNTSGVGGAALAVSQQSVTLTNVILSRNTDSVDPDANFNTLSGGSIAAASRNNLIDVPADSLGVGTLADNGGPTQTVVLLADSPARNAGVGVAGLESDQRGISRLVEDAVDIGAVEFIPTSLMVTVLDSGSNDDYSSDDLSLFEAIRLAEFQPDASTVSFDPTLFLDGRQSITLTNVGDTSSEYGRSAFVIATDVSIVGPSGPNGLTIQSDFDGDAADEETFRAFLVEAGGKLSLSSFTLTGFESRGADGVSGDDTSGGSGGAIYINGGEVDLSAMLLTGNVASGGDSSGNAGNGFGGAVYVDGGSLSAVNTTISGNSALGGVGGVDGMGFGGGVAVRNGDLNLLNTTIASNSASEGGALYVVGDGDVAVVDLKNSILADSIASSDYFEATVNSGAVSDTGANNLIETGADSFGGSDTIEVDPQLATLADNGGPTWTHFPSANSSVIDAGNDVAIGSVSVDQRGETRIIRAHVDLGAVEVQPVLSIAADAVSRNEENSDSSSFTFTVTRSSSVIGAATVDYEVSGSAVSADDFVGGVLPSGTVSFADSEATRTITIAVLGDLLVEQDEAFTVTLKNPSSGIVIGTNSASSTITNDDAATLSIGDVALDEDDGTMTFTIAMSHPVDEEVTIDYSTATDSATGDDFTATSGTATIAAGSTTTIVSVMISSDDLVELDEQFFVNLSNIQSSGRDVTIADAQAVGTITNDDAAGVQIDDVTQDEDAGVMTFTITIDEVIDADLTVDFATMTDSAADDDFTETTGTATIAAGTTSTTVTVSIAADDLVELDEQYFVELTNVLVGGREVSIVDASGIGTITNDDAASLQIDDVSQDENAGVMTFTLTLVETVDVDVTVDYETVVDSATASDFERTTGTATITAGSNSTTISVPITADDIVELDEQFFIQLSNLQASGRNVTISDASGTGTIANDDAANVQVSDVTQDENTGAMSFTISLDQVADADVTVDFETLFDSATGGDYTATSGTATIAAGSNSTTVSVAITADDVVEFDEQFFVEISNVQTNGRDVTISDAIGIGTIKNDDAANIRINDVAQDEDAGVMTFTVSLDKAVDTDVTVDYSTMTDSANGEDFTEASGTATIAAGTTSTTISVAVNVDELIELDERFFVQLANVQSGGRNVTISDATGTGTITNDDQAAIRINDVSRDENAGMITFTVIQDEVVDADVLVDFNTVADGATALDFTTTSGTATITAGSNTTTVSVAVTADDVVELNEQFSVELSNVQASGRAVTISDSTGTGTIVNDDAANVRISDVTQNEDAGVMSFMVTIDEVADTDVIVDFSTAFDSATSSDFTAASATATIAAGTTSTTIAIAISADDVVELDEQFFVHLANVEAGGRDVAILDSTGIGHIVNDDAARIRIDDVTQAEDAGVMTFTVSLDQATDADVLVNFATQADTVYANDFSATSGVATISAGSLSTTISVAIGSDGRVELDERLFVDLSNVQATGRAVTILDSRGVGNILDDDIAEVTINDVVRDERAGMLTFRIELDRVADANVSIDFSTLISTADSSDFAMQSGTATIAAGTRTAKVSVDIADDEIVELNEQFIMNLSNLQPNGRNVVLVDSQGIGTIRNDDAAILRVSHVMQDEDAGVMTFTIMTDHLLDADVSVDFSTTPDGANENDFTATSGTATISAGSASATVTVPITADNLGELDEVLFLNLANAQAVGRDVAISESQGVGTIVNDDATTITINDVVQDEDTGLLTFTITLNRLVDADISVEFYTIADEENANDFTEVSGTATIAAGSTSTTVTVAITPDENVELDERVLVNLENVQSSGRDVTILDSQGVGTIRNDDVANVSISDAQQAEDSGVMNFLVTVDRLVDTDVVVEYETVVGTAGNDDFVPQSGQLVIPANVNSGIISIDVLADAVVELDEQFQVRLTGLRTSGRSVQIADAEGLGEILNNDSARIFISNTSVVEGNRGERGLTFTVTLDAAVDQPVSVQVSSADGTATVADGDYVASINQTLVFAGLIGETQNFTVQIATDTEIEFDETVFARLGNLQDNQRDVSISVADAVGTIFNDDLGTNTGQVIDRTIPETAVNLTYSEAVSGNFDGSPNSVDADDLFFWDPSTGANRIVFGDGTVQDNPVAIKLLNGRSFVQILAGNFDDGLGTDLFFWNPIDGQNRLIHFSGSTGNVVGDFEENVLPATQINGLEFTTVVSGNLDGAGPDDLFFWDPLSGRNRIAHMETVANGTRSAVNNVQDEAIPRTVINGDYTTLRVGQFAEGGLDELFFVNLMTGQNRLVSLVTDSPGETTGFAAFDTNFISTDVFNNEDFGQLEVADLNGDGLSDIFAWNPLTGANRAAVTDPDLDISPEVIEDLFGSQGINGDYRRVVRLTDEVFSSSAVDQLFFWNPETGQNRLANTTRL